MRIHATKEWWHGPESSEIHQTKNKKCLDLSWDPNSSTKVASVTRWGREVRFSGCLARRLSGLDETVVPSSQHVCISLLIDICEIEMSHLSFVQVLKCKYNIFGDHFTVYQ